MVSRRENTYRTLHMNELTALTSNGSAHPTAWQIWCEPCSKSSIWIWLSRCLAAIRGAGGHSSLTCREKGSAAPDGAVALHANRCERAARGRRAVARA
jgi:hypothetical protein